MEFKKDFIVKEHALVKKSKFIVLQLHKDGYWYLLLDNSIIVRDKNSDNIMTWINNNIEKI